MKQLLYILFFVQFTSFAQCDSTNIVQYPDEDAQFPGGAAVMMKFVQENIEYPEIQRCSYEHPTVRIYLKFIVCTDGTIQDIACLRCSDTEYDQIAIELIRKMPDWIPATVGGKAVSSFVLLPISIYSH